MERVSDSGAARASRAHAVHRSHGRLSLVQKGEE